TSACSRRARSSFSNSASVTAKRLAFGSMPRRRIASGNLICWTNGVGKVCTAILIALTGQLREKLGERYDGEGDVRVGDRIGDDEVVFVAHRAAGIEDIRNVAVPLVVVGHE